MFENTNIYLIILYILSVTFILILLKKYILEKNPNYKEETFIQEPPFIIKRNENLYDEFFAKIYDTVFHPDSYEYYDEHNIFMLTQPEPSQSVILDIGSGTGNFAYSLTQKGFTNINCLDKSIEMSKVCIQKYPDINVICQDAMDSMIFDKSTYTHIFCIDMTIYEIKDRIRFFRNCYFWLKSNSYLILHLVNRNSFDTICPVAKPVLLKNANEHSLQKSPQIYTSTRITETNVDFGKFKYKSSYDFSKKDIVIFTETFIDSYSLKVRKNEKELYMSHNMEDILYDAQYCGFLVVGQITMTKDPNQFLFILERPH
jgi:SAM-dependent methyltransferase